ncbi:hypothetical protein BO82DRAFT_356806 [Aspergillus uvarum CBS 121591]|uniref:Uncharacterized protein n=1 Tax=Aspergillus uvarum CBS 121591 TaxID=1448315 RepID=A0A319DH91_9EURO|nr:hypothetical protein BO82DRAFT_356806 [Aspergillus uvarum CBS 121591]PYH79002.1 hypothetical protein BO82DRAFT_356806 [Aspergillus uvarum CBS 121591]
MATSQIETLSDMWVLFLAECFSAEEGFQLAGTTIIPTSPSAKGCETPIFYRVLRVSDAKGKPLFTTLIAAPVACPQAATTDPQKVLRTLCGKILRCYLPRHTTGELLIPVAGAVVVGDELRLCWDLLVPGTPGLKRAIEKVMGRELVEQSQTRHAHSRDGQFVATLLREVKAFLKPWSQSGKVDGHTENGDDDGQVDGDAPEDEITLELADAYLREIAAGSATFDVASFIMLDLDG